MKIKNGLILLLMMRAGRQKNSGNTTCLFADDLLKPNKLAAANV